ncbi:hypothetical protein AKJ47_02810, partial [candidate division MSBL1 archaeon SCGC-AAA261G05]
PKEVSQEEDDFILYVGRLVKTKGLDILAKAMKNIDVRLLVCGEGPTSRSLKNIENVELLGFVPEDEKNRLLRKCKFLVLPSKGEAFGIALLEAMAFGKPVVASNVGGISEVVGDGGILVPPNDPEKLGIAINTLLENGELRLKLGKKSWRRVRLFSWNKIVPQVEDMYQEVLS